MRRYVDPLSSTAESELKRPTQASGTSVTVMPIARLIEAAKALPVHAMRFARSGRPAPMFVPTSTTIAWPTANTSGICRSSRRSPTP